MSDEKAVTVQEVDLAEWRSRQEVAQMGKRIKALLPGGDRLTDAESMSLAQYSLAMGANPFRGEVYGFRGRNGFQIVEGYKLLSRWAQRQCPFTEKYEPTPAEEVPEGSIGVRCWILRDDKKQTMREFVQMGAQFKEAYELCATFADGIIDANDLKRQPPTGWTWEQVARKRALKNALNLSHGAPSLKEIAAQSWEVNGHETIADDWKGIAPGMAQAEREAIADKNATFREAHELAENSGINAAQATDDLFGDYTSDGQESVIVGEVVGDGGEFDAGTIASWSELKELAVSRLGFHHEKHVENTLKKIFDGNQDGLTFGAAWSELEAYQNSKSEAPA